MTVGEIIFHGQMEDVGFSQSLNGPADLHRGNGCSDRACFLGALIILCSEDLEHVLILFPDLIKHHCL